MLGLKENENERRGKVMEEGPFISQDSFYVALVEPENRHICVCLYSISLSSTRKYKHMTKKALLPVISGLNVLQDVAAGVFKRFSIEGVTLTFELFSVLNTF